MSQVAVGDPLELAVHWAKHDGPIKRYEPVGDGNHDQALLRVRTLNSMIFTVVDPDGIETELRPKISGSNEEKYPYGLYYQPTYILA